MTKSQNTVVGLSILLLAVAAPASALKGEMTKGGKPGMAHHGKIGHGMGYLFSPSWKDTLTNEQKVQVDRLRLALKKSKSVLKARLKVKKVELANLVIQDNPDQDAMYRKIDEIVKLKRDTLRMKYDFKIKLRAMLTPEQRVTFDLRLLEKAQRPKHRGR